MGRIYDATWGRLFSAAYDRGMKASEEAGLRQMRHDLLAQARGRVLEIGVGTGLNLEHYPAGIEGLTLVEPDPHMTRRLREKLGQTGLEAELVEAPAEQLPFPEDSFDTVALTLVLCTVPDPEAALAETRRVLKPDGRLLLLEHVRSPDPRLARWQDRWERPWRFLADGCYCNRDTAATIAAAGFELGEVERGALPRAASIVRPLIRGSAWAA
jgi:ubiquinone/menaquinone biosynthesis C-methylase UbiE